MKSQIRATVLSTIFLVGTGRVAPSDAQSFVPGHIYAPIDGGSIVEWDGGLNEVRQFSVNGVSTATGVTFSDHGTLVFIGLRNSTTNVMEVDATGKILNDYDTGRGGLLRGSYIAFDPTQRIYAFANETQVTYLNANLSLIGSTPSIFQRASGVTFGPNGLVYATDQFQTQIRVFDTNRQLQQSISFPGSAATGLDFNGANQLYVALFGDGLLRKLDLGTNQQSTIVSGLGFGGISDVEVLPGGNLLATGFRSNLSLYSAQGLLLDSNSGAGTFGDSAALYVPEPSAGLLLAIGVAIAIPHMRFKFCNKP